MPLQETLRELRCHLDKKGLLFFYLRGGCGGGGGGGVGERGFVGEGGGGAFFVFFFFFFFKSFFFVVFMFGLVLFLVCFCFGGWEGFVSGGVGDYFKLGLWVLGLFFGGFICLGFCVEGFCVLWCVIWFFSVLLGVRRWVCWGCWVWFFLMWGVLSGVVGVVF